MTNDDCKRRRLFRNVQDDEICGFRGPDKDGVAACAGDSGGPMICQSEYGYAVLTGIISWGNVCTRRLQDVFVNVHYFKNWIKTETYRMYG